MSAQNARERFDPAAPDLTKTLALSRRNRALRDRPGYCRFVFFSTEFLSVVAPCGPAQDRSIRLRFSPFENASNDPNAEYLSEGISEALINSLTELQQLRVIARSTAFHYKGKDVDPKKIGEDLKVATVLTGRVRQMQDALSVQVDFIDAMTGAQLWGAAYDRKISDVVAVKQAIAYEVTQKLKLKLSGEEERRLVKRDTANAEAYQSTCADVISGIGEPRMDSTRRLWNFNRRSSAIQISPSAMSD